MIRKLVADECCFRSFPEASRSNFPLSYPFETGVPRPAAG